MTWWLWILVGFALGFPTGQILFWIQHRHLNPTNHQLRIANDCLAAKLGDTVRIQEEGHDA